jgi:hypothetical protein
LLRVDFCDSDSLFENERRANLEQSRMADRQKLRSLGFRAGLRRLADFWRRFANS